MCAPLRIARGGSRARLYEAITIRESLDGFIRDRGGLPNSGSTGQRTTRDGVAVAKIVPVGA
jgi:hypothetical protein